VRSADAGPPAMCTVGQCNMMPRCIPIYQTACCLLDQTCGCQVVIPAGPCL
jgi:hypothetical protein